MSDDNANFLYHPVIGGWRTMLPLAVAILFFGSSALLMGRGLNTLPKVSMPDEGRTYPLEEHRRVVFGTLGETALVYGLLIVGFAVGAVGIGHEKRIRALISTNK